MAALRPARPCRRSAERRWSLRCCEPPAPSRVFPPLACCFFCSFGAVSSAIFHLLQALIAGVPIIYHGQQHLGQLVLHSGHDVDHLVRKNTSDRPTVISPTPILMGKPTTRTFNWGTVFTITPMEALTSSRTMTIGAAIFRPSVNTVPNSRSRYQAPPTSHRKRKAGPPRQDWNMAATRIWWAPVTKNSSTASR